jgi:RNA polymerase sigma-70 factor (ECF subfamily)
MPDTSLSLLDRARRNDEVAWRRLRAMYVPLIQGWLRRECQLQVHDADDLVQDVIVVVVRRLPEFDRQRVGSFRAWLRTVTVNCLRQSLRTRHRGGAGTGDSRVADLLDALEAQGSPQSELWDREHDEHVMRQILNSLKHEFTENTWQAFSLMSLDGLSAADAAARLGITPNAVFIARSRVLARMREEAAGLID